MASFGSSSPSDAVDEPLLPLSWLLLIDCCHPFLLISLYSAGRVRYSSYCHRTSPTSPPPPFARPPAPLYASGARHHPPPPQHHRILCLDMRHQPHLTSMVPRRLSDLSILTFKCSFRSHMQEELPLRVIEHLLFSIG